MIINDTPVTADAFTGMWVRRLLITPTLLTATLLPYDGGDHILATGAKQVVLTNLGASRAVDSQLDEAMSAIHAEAARLADTESPLMNASVSATSPTQPVVIVLRFESGANHIIRDAYAAAGDDATFAGVFAATMAEIARQAGLTVE